jgi:hypothetical protein
MLSTRMNNLRNFLKNRPKIISIYMLNKNNFYFSQKNKTNETETVEKVNTTKLIEIFDQELKQAESGYESVMAEGQEYLKKNKWVLFEKENDLTMELKKNQGEFGISIRFQSKPPETVDNTKESHGK